MQHQNKLTESDVKLIVSEYCNIPAEKLHSTMMFGKDIIIDSIEIGEILMKLKKENNNINQKKLFEIKTL